ncbi:hypothetical protein BDN71DRAFT_1592991 [Pleurotus eryngii]|uniref:Uncharacterized protein n=1 Tax=Pleurotus eryngii TaxID=5323 RepID=A0A9P5ZQU2_PLEER|nr:hypothetical protein BDN71DRAFT_1592991 [Pleurotus eryngii]
MGQEARNGKAEAPKWEARPQTASDVWNRADFGSPGSLRKLAEASPKNRPPLCPSRKKDTPRTVRHPHMTVTHPLRSLGTADSCRRAPGSIATDSRASAPLLLLPLPVSPPLSPRIASLNAHVYGEALGASGGHVVPHPADSAQPRDMAKEVPYLALDALQWCQTITRWGDHISGSATWARHLRTGRLRIVLPNDEILPQGALQEGAAYLSPVHGPT